MSNDPAHHRAMLHLLELLMDAEAPGMSLPVLAQRLQGAVDQNEARWISGAVEQAGGLRSFLLKHPALFRIHGDVAWAVVGAGDTGSGSGSGDELSGLPEEPAALSNGGHHAPDLSASSGAGAAAAVVLEEVARESEAVRFFQSRLSGRREDRWVTVKSLAACLAQAPAEVRSVAGQQQADLARFLAKHGRVFEIQGELVGLRDCWLGAPESQHQLPLPPQHRLRHTHSARTARPRSLLLACKSASGGAGRSGSLDDASAAELATVAAAAATTVVTMSAEEFQAVDFLRRTVERASSARTGEPGGGCATLGQLFAALSGPGDSAEQARTQIGWTQVELTEFLGKHWHSFDLARSGSEVRLRPPKHRPSVVIGNSDALKGEHQHPQPLHQSMLSSPRTLTNRRGRVFHCARLWGIIDLGRHEHVFFDRSMFKHVEDLQKYFKVNDTLYFNAVLAPKDSRAKWRATQVWREGDRPAPLHHQPQHPQPQHQQHRLLELADDVKFLSDIDESELRRVLRDDENWRTLSSPSSLGDLDDAASLPGEAAGEICAAVVAAADTRPLLCQRCAAADMISVATQTMSTGEIMAMQIFHDL